MNINTESRVKTTWKQIIPEVGPAKMIARLGAIKVASVYREVSGSGYHVSILLPSIKDISHVPTEKKAMALAEEAIWQWIELAQLSPAKTQPESP